MKTALEADDIGLLQRVGDLLVGTSQDFRPELRLRPFGAHRRTYPAFRAFVAAVTLLRQRTTS